MIAFDQIPENGTGTALPAVQRGMIRAFTV
jgi:hypothetical protein